MKSLKELLLLLVQNDPYPVGSIYMSVNNVNPSTLFGGQWEQIKDTFLLAAGSTYSNGATGGEASHTLTSEESGLPKHGHGFTQPTVPKHGHGFTQPKIPNHSHSMGNLWSSGSGSSSAYTMSGSRALTTRKTATDGGGGACTGGAVIDKDAFKTTGGAVSDNTGAEASKAHNNMPPYLAVNVWKRVG